MATRKVLSVSCLILLLIPMFAGAAETEPAKKKILVVSSYHREYRWSKESNEGLCAAMLKFGYFDGQDQAVEFSKNDFVATSRIILKKLWLDAKRKGGKDELAASTAAIAKQVREFKPDIMLLGDDDAAEYVGGQFLDTTIPVVFWGVNNTPVKYGLVDSEDRPGHNVTGVFQSGYKEESLQFLKTLVPGIKTFAILSDDTSAGRNHIKALEYLDRQNALPVKLVESVSTGDYDQWKQKTLELQKKADAFYVAQYSGLKNRDGQYVTTTEVARWYLANINIPETTQGQFVKDGMLCAAYDAGYNQGYEAATIAFDILDKGADPATYRPRAPKRGPLMVNRQRAAMLGLKLTKEMGIEEYFDRAEALAAPKETVPKKRVLVVSSYHREYRWSQETNDGLCAAMLQYGYFDNKKQAEEFTQNDYVESSQVILKKLWMDAKRKSNQGEMEQSSLDIYQTARDFSPDLIFLGDDDAARYIGSKFLDTEVPIVFWGVNNTPVKYGLVDSLEKPGHNMTGVYQPGYKIESIEFLRAIVKNIKTFAVLSDNTSAGRNHIKAIEYLDRSNALPIKLVESISTDKFEVWKKKALELQSKVDAYFVAQYSGLKDDDGNYIPAEKVAEWYVTNIKIPEAVDQGQFVKQGMLCGANDSGYNQGYEAVAIAHDILVNGASPATYPPRPPKRGALMVNKKRANMLGIDITNDMGIDEIIE